MTHSDGPFLRSHDKGSRFLEASRDVCHVEITPTACGPSLSEGSKAENWILWPDRLPLRVPASWRAMTCRSVAVRGLVGGTQLPQLCPSYRGIKLNMSMSGHVPLSILFRMTEKVWRRVFMQHLVRNYRYLPEDLLVFFFNIHISLYRKL